MPLLIAKAAYRYGTRQLQPEDQFEASEKDARILKLAKRAIDAPQQLTESAGDLLGDSTRRGRRYQRRDMVSES